MFSAFVSTMHALQLRARARAPGHGHRRRADVERDERVALHQRGGRLADRLLLGGVGAAGVLERALLRADEQHRAAVHAPHLPARRERVEIGPRTVTSETPNISPSSFTRRNSRVRRAFSMRARRAVADA